MASRRRISTTILSPLPSAARFPTTNITPPDFTHVVIGSGIIGLSTARQLTLRPRTSTLLLERHPTAGTETSSRNSQVLHAGLYYGAQSLKARLCVRGRHLAYGFCRARRVPHARVGKWIVAQDEGQRRRLEDIVGVAGGELGVPLRWLSRKEVDAEGEGVRALAGALESPETGIVDSHSFMTALHTDFENQGGTTSFRSHVQDIEPLGNNGSSGWRLHVLSEDSPPTTITTETIINAAGLNATTIHNLIVPASRRLSLHLAKGSYFSYAASRPRISRLVYPAPDARSAGLGTHLTIDLGGRMRFGPDVEWVNSVDDLSVGTARLSAVADEVRRYLPGLDPSQLVPDYAGIRPKLSRGAALAGGKDFQDFIIRKEDGYEGWVNLLGIESPGLTSCLAIAEMVEQLLYGSVSSTD